MRVVGECVGLVILVDRRIMFGFDMGPKMGVVGNHGGNYF